VELVVHVLEEADQELEAVQELVVAQELDEGPQKTAAQHPAAVQVPGFLPSDLSTNPVPHSKPPVEFVRHLLGQPSKIPKVVGLGHHPVPSAALQVEPEQTSLSDPPRSRHPTDDQPPQSRDHHFYYFLHHLRFPHHDQDDQDHTGSIFMLRHFTRSIISSPRV